MITYNWSMAITGIIAGLSRSAMHKSGPKKRLEGKQVVCSGSAALFSSSTHGLSAPLETVVPALAWLKNLGRSMERTKRRVWTATKPRRQHGQDRSEDRGGPSNGKNYGKTGAKMVVLQIRLWENRIICSYKRGWRTMLKHVVLDHVEACCSGPCWSMLFCVATILKVSLPTGMVLFFLLWVYRPI